MQKIRTKTGAASFYIVAFTTLLLSVIVVGFITIVLSEMARTANNDLSQSAYDSALAGVEDAMVAILNYQSCINQGATETIPTASGQVTCGEIIYYMNHADCDMVGHILSRIGKDESKEELFHFLTPFFCSSGLLFMISWAIRQRQASMVPQSQTPSSWSL